MRIKSFTQEIQNTFGKLCMGCMAYACMSCCCAKNEIRIC